MSEIIIGIDLGTTNSEVAVIRDGRPCIIEVDGSRLLPSMMGLADDGAGGEARAPDLYLDVAALVVVEIALGIEGERVLAAELGVALGVGCVELGEGFDEVQAPAGL